MRVRLLTRYASPVGNYGPGMVIDLPVAEAEMLVASGYAMGVDVETAMMGPVEAAVMGRRGEPLPLPPPLKGRGDETLNGRGDETLNGRGDETLNGRGDETLNGRGEETLKGMGDEKPMKGRGEGKTMKGKVR